MYIVFYAKTKNYPSLKHKIMDENLINTYAFEFFSREKLFNAEFNVFQAEQRVEKARLSGMEETFLINFKAQVIFEQERLEKLKTQLQEFKQKKNINN